MLGVKPYEKIAFKKVHNMIVLTPATNFLSLKGSIKTKKKYSDNKADQKILAFIKKEYAQAD